MQQFMPAFGPYMTPQQRLNYMEQQYPQFAQQPMPQQSNQELITIPVTNVDEANAFRVNPNGTPTLFYNAGDNEIYLKKTNRETGKADFQVFKIIEQPIIQQKQAIETSNFEKELKTLNEKMDGLYSLFATVHQVVGPEEIKEPEEQQKIVNTKGTKNVK